MKKAIFKLFFLAFIIIPPLIFIPGNFRGHWTFTQYREPKLASLLILFWGMATYFWYSLLKDYKKQLKQIVQSLTFLLLCLLSVYSLASALWSEVPEAALYEGVQWITFTFMFCIFSCLFTEQKWLSLAIYSIIGIFGIVTIIGLTQTFIDIPFLKPIPGTTIGSTFGSKNVCFLSLVSQFFLLIFVFWESTYKKQIIFVAATGIIILLEIAYILISLSRTTYAAIMIGLFSLFLILFFISSRNKRILVIKSSIIIGLGLCIISLLVCNIYPQKWHHVKIRISKGIIPLIVNPTSYFYKTARGQVIHDSFAMIKDNPFGVGAGNWIFKYPLYHHSIKKKSFNKKTQIQRVHNDYIQYLAELGIPGFAAFMGLIIWQFVKLLHILLHHDQINIYTKAFNICLLSQLMAVCVMLFFSFYLEFPYRKFLFVFLLTLIYNPHSDLFTPSEK